MRSTRAYSSVCDNHNQKRPFELLELSRLAAPPVPFYGFIENERPEYLFHETSSDSCQTFELVIVDDFLDLLGCYNIVCVYIIVAIEETNLTDITVPIVS